MEPEEAKLKEIQSALDFCKEVTASILGDKYRDLKEMAEAYNQRFPKLKCGNFWDMGESISLTCEECRMHENSCVCLDCFLHQNHEGHHCKISLNSSGNCDCGDSAFWKPECFCSKHKGQIENPESLLEPEERELFLNSFTRIGKELSCNNELKVITYLKYLAQFVQFGDPVSRLLAIALTPFLTIDLHINATKNVIVPLLQFESSIINDTYFVKNFLVYLLESTREIFIACISPNYNFESLARFVFHAYSQHVVQALIEKHPDDWYKIFTGHIEAISSAYKSITVNGPNENSKFADILAEYISLYKKLINVTQDKEKLTEFALAVVKILAETEFSYSFTCKREGDKEDDDPFQQSVNQVRHYYHSLMSSIFDSINPYIDPYPIFEYYITFMRSRNVDYNVIKCAVDEDCEIYVYLTLHKIIGQILQDSKKPIEIISETAKKMNIPIDDICRILCYYPIRLYAALFYNEKKYFVRNQDMIMNTLFLIPIYFVHDLTLKQFYLIQLAAGLMSVDKFIEIIRETFRVGPEDITDSYFLFFTNIIFDRLVYRNDDVEIFDQEVFLFLRQNSLPLQSVLRICFTNSSLDRIVEIKKITTMKENKDGEQLLTLKDENSFSFIAPWYTTKDTHNIIRSFTSKNPTQLLPFKNSDEIEGFHLLSYLYTEEYNNLCRKMILSQDSEFTMIAINSLILEAQHPLTQTAEQLCFTPININTFVREKNENDSDLFTFLLNMGVVGEETLRRMNVGEIPVREETKNLKKIAAQERKKAILAQMNEQQNAFLAKRMNSSEKIEIDLQTFTCPICQINKKMNGEEEEPFGYPVYFIKGPKIENKRRLLFFSCGHLMHFDCGYSDASGKCPLDRTRFRTMLPQFDENGKLTNSISKKYAEQFLEQIGGLSNLIEGIANEIITMELRFRTNPDAIYRANQDILRSLYLLFLHFFDASKVDELEKASNETPLISQIITSNIDESTTFIQTVHDSAWSLESPLDVFILCRRAALFSHFCLGNNLFKEFESEWDDILKSSYLSTMFDLSIPESVDSDLKPYQFPFKLPQNYLYFIQPPYNFNFAKNNETYVILNEEKIALYDQYNLFRHLYDTKNTYAFVLRISGSRLSTIFGVYNSMISDIRPLYLNTNGDEDPGLRQGYFLYLSDQRYEQLTDIYLSGQWIVADL